MEAIFNAIKSKDSSLFVQSLLSSWDAKIASLEEVKEFLSKSVSTVTAQLTAEGKKISQLDDTEKGLTINEFSDLQLLEPRGRFKVAVATKCLILEGKSGGGNIFVDNILTFILLPSHFSSKKEGEDLLAVIFHDPVKICGKDMNHILFNLSRTPVKPKGSDPEQVATIESKVFCDAISKTFGIKIQQPDPRLFRSSTQKPFVRCYKGTQEGALYPLKCGLIFAKPLLFLTIDEIAALTAGRGGSGNTRFVDLKIETTEEKIVEFGSIEREELGALQMYIKGYLEVRKSNHQVKTEDKQPQELLNNQEGEDSDEEDDDDYDPNQSGSDSDRSHDDDDSASGKDNSDQDVDEDHSPEKRKAKRKQGKGEAGKGKGTVAKKAKVIKGPSKTQSKEQVKVKDQPTKEVVVDMTESPIVVDDGCERRIGDCN